jgi:integrase
MHYFGQVAGDEDGRKALTLWEERRDDLYAGRKPRPKDQQQGATVEYICNRFLYAKELQVQQGNLTQLSWNDYKATCERLAAEFGKSTRVSSLGSADFEKLQSSIAKTRGPVARGNDVQRVRVVFTYAFDAGDIDAPPRFGPMFKRPDRKTLLKVSAKQFIERGEKYIEAADLRRLVEGADVQLKAMILLAVNCGFGNSDCGHLPVSALDMNGGWVTFPRPKNGRPRRAKLWPETQDAIKAALAKRPKPRTPAAEPLLFVTKYGAPWVKDDVIYGAITNSFSKLLQKLGMRRKGIGFYTLRHVHRTVSGRAGDQPAANYVMGHSDGTMAENYTRWQSEDDPRLAAVCEHIRLWLFGTAVKAAPDKPSKPKRPAKPARKKTLESFSTGHLRVVG